MRLKEYLKTGGTALGTWISMPSPSVVEVISRNGMDFVIIDTEHGPVSIERAEDMVRAAEVAGADALIRVSAKEAHQILRALDIGASGVQVPHISDKRAAEDVVKNVKYYPEGERGFSPFTRSGGYGSKGKGYTAGANNSTIVVLNVEGREGVENIEDIAKVKGVDVVFIGPYDLSQSLGIPGDVRDPKVLKAIKDCVSACEREGKVCGSFACDGMYLEILAGCGVRYLTCMVDTSIISKAVGDIVSSYRKAMAK